MTTFNLSLTQRIAQFAMDLFILTWNAWPPLL